MPKETDSDLPVNVQESSKEVWVSDGLLQGQSIECGSACTGPLEGGHHYLHSVQFSHSLVSNTLEPHRLQHDRSPCLSPTPRVYSNSCPFILCRPLLLLPSIFPSIRVFSNESFLRIRRPKYWSFNFSISPSSEYSGLISFRMDWLDLLAVQETLKSLLQHHSSKA